MMIVNIYIRKKVHGIHIDNYVSHCYVKISLKEREEERKGGTPLELMHFFIVTRFPPLFVRRSAYLHEIHCVNK